MIGLVMGMLFWDEYTAKFAKNPLFSDFLKLNDAGEGIAPLGWLATLNSKGSCIEFPPQNGIYEKDASLGDLNVFDRFNGMTPD